jgi:hypothetical protein
MRNIFVKGKNTRPETSHIAPEPSRLQIVNVQTWAEAVRNSSDESGEFETESDGDSDEPVSHMLVASNRLPIAPPRKRQRREILYRTERIAKREKREREVEDALKDLQKLMKSKKTRYVAGPDGLQAC